MDELWDADDHLFASDDEGEDVGEGDKTGDWKATSGGVAQHYLFLIDSHADMWKKKSKGGSTVKDVLQFLEQFTRSAIQESVVYSTGKRNGLCALLYGTKLCKPGARDPRFEKPKEDETSSSRRRGDYEETQTETQAGMLAEEDEEDKNNDEDEDDEDVFDFYSRDKETTVHELIPCAKPGKATAEKIRETIESVEQLGEEYTQPPEELEACDQCLLSLGIATGKSLLEKETWVHTKETASQKKDRIQVWIWTNQDNPVRGDQMLAQIQDMQEEGMFNIVLWGLPKPDGSPFDYSLFYEKELDETVQMPMRDETLTVEESEGDLWGIYGAKMETYWKPTRPTYRAMPLLLPDWEDAKMDADNAYLLDWYRLNRTRARPTLVKISQETGKKVESLTQWVSGGGEVLYQKMTGPGEKAVASPLLRSFVKLGEDRVNLDEDDKRIIKTESSSVSFFSLILIGFRPIATFPELLTTETSYICVPTTKVEKKGMDPEEAMNQSNNVQALAALHQAMIESEVVAVGEYLSRSSSTSRLVALHPLPREEGDDMDGDGGALDPENESLQFPWPKRSFLAVPLPFAEEIRAYDPPKEEDVEDEVPDMDALVSASTALIEKQSLADHEIGQAFENPKLAQYWGYIEALAFNENEQNLGEDNEFSGFTFGNFLEDTLDEIRVMDNLLPKAVHRSTVGKKRKTAGASTKKTKTKANPADDSGLDWDELFRNQEINSRKTTVAALQSFLKSRGEKATGKKAVLAEKVTRILRTELTEKAKQIKSSP